jgi:hypothetical protein
MCKFLATTVAEATASKCINWMGGNGITEQVQPTKSCARVISTLLMCTAVHG